MVDYRNIRSGQHLRFVGPGKNKGRVGMVNFISRGMAYIKFFGDDDDPMVGQYGTPCYPHHLAPVTRREREVALAACALGIKEAPPCDTKTPGSDSGADGATAATAP